jgi:hypothetical protein
LNTFDKKQGTEIPNHAKAPIAPNTKKVVTTMALGAFAAILALTINAKAHKDISEADTKAALDGGDVSKIESQEETSNDELGIDSFDESQNGPELPASPLEYFDIEEYKENGKTMQRITGFDLPEQFRGDVVIPKEIDEILLEGRSRITLYLSEYAESIIDIPDFLKDRIGDMDESSRWENFGKAIGTKWALINSISFEKGSELKRSEGLSLYVDKLIIPDKCEEFITEGSSYALDLICGKNTKHVLFYTVLNVDITKSKYRFELDSDGYNTEDSLRLNIQKINGYCIVTVKDRDEAVAIAKYFDHQYDDPKVYEGKFEWMKNYLIKIKDGNPKNAKEYLDNYDGIFANNESYYNKDVTYFDDNVSIINGVTYRNDNLPEGYERIYVLPRNGSGEYIVVTAEKNTVKNIP